MKLVIDVGTSMVAFWILCDHEKVSEHEEIVLEGPLDGKLANKWECLLRSYASLYGIVLCGNCNANLDPTSKKLIYKYRYSLPI